MAELGGTVGNFDLAANYLHVNDENAMGLKGDNKIWTAAATYNSGKFSSVRCTSRVMMTS